MGKTHCRPPWVSFSSLSARSTEKPESPSGCWLTELRFSKTRSRVGGLRKVGGLRGEPFSRA